MKQLTIFLLLLALFMLPASCAAENISIGGSLQQQSASEAQPDAPARGSASSQIGGGLSITSGNSQNAASGPLNSGFGGGLSSSSHAPSETARSADDRSGMRPSPEWLSDIDAEQISDICTLLYDPSFIEISGIPEESVESFNTAASYGPEPALVIYAPKSVPIWLKLALRSYNAQSEINDPGHICDTITASICTSMEYEDLARTSWLIMDSYYPADTPFVPTIAVYTSTDGSESDAVMITHVYSDGIMHISTRFITSGAFKCITDKESNIHTLCSTLNAGIFTAEDEFPEFSAGTSMPAGVEVPVADDAWLSGISLSLAGDMLKTKCNAEYASMFTLNQDIINICTDVGTFDIENAAVISVERFDEAMLLAGQAFDLEGESSELLKRYVAQKLAFAMINQAAARHGETYVAAASICTASDSFFADADFTSCNVTLSCGGSYNIVVSFSKHGDSIVNAVVRPVPAE